MSPVRHDRAPEPTLPDHEPVTYAGSFDGTPFAITESIMHTKNFPGRKALRRARAAAIAHNATPSAKRPPGWARIDIPMGHPAVKDVKMRLGASQRDADGIPHPSASMENVGKKAPAAKAAA